MRTALSGLAVVVLGLGAGAQCGDGASGPSTPPPPPPPVFTSLEVSPSSSRLFTRPPGTTVVVSVAAKDQSNRVMTGLGSASFSSSNAGVAIVAQDGTVTSVAPGTAVITAALTAGGVT